MLKEAYNKLIRKIVGVAFKYPVRMLLITIALTIPTLFLVTKITIDTNLIKLLPSDSPSVQKVKELQDKVGDGGQFIVIFEGDNQDNLKKAIEFSTAKISQFPEVRNVQYKYPREFVEKYKYLLIPNDYLNELVETVIKKEAENNPFSDNIIDEPDAKYKKVTHGMKENQQDMQILLQQYMNMPEYHQSSDGKVFGMLIPTKDGIASLGNIQKLYDKIKVVSDEATKKFGVWSGISGNHRNKLVDYKSINDDLGIATIFSFIGIFIVLLNSFRSFWQILAVILPLVFGLLWSFAFVPITFGSLNLITSFLVIILYGLGIDFPIHFIKRFRIEIENREIIDALAVTFSDTGKSVVVSALTTAAGFIIVIFSNFRGFFEYGILSSLAIIMILIAMYLVLPPAVVLLWKYGKLKNGISADKKIYVPNKGITILLIALTGIGVYFTASGLKFDYFLSNTSFAKNGNNELEIVNKKKDKVYSASMSPAAIYAAPNLQALDSLNSILNAERRKSGTMINRVRSIRDFAPNEVDFAERKDLLNELRDLVSASWTEKLQDTSFKSLIKDFLAWQMPEEAPKVDELPAFISNNLMGANNSGYYLSTVYPSEERKDGRVAMAFTKQLNTLKLPANVKGPVGETIIFSEVLTLVFGEAWWIIVFGQLLVFLVVLVVQRNFKQSIIMFIPLVAGMAMTFGLFAIFDFKITFFNVVCITALMGMGVDGGIHYINRWLYNNKDVQIVQNELFEPLYSAFFTVIFGYAGMIFSQHSGLRSMGILSALGMTLIMIANLALLPGLLKIYSKLKK